MPKLPQEEFLNRVENQLEEQLKDAISVFQNLGEDVLLNPSVTNGWSIAECIEHLNSYAEYYLPLIETAIVKAPSLDGSVFFNHSVIGKYFINSMDSSKSKKKFKALKRHLPVNVSNPNGVVSTFIQHLEKMLELIKLAHNKDLRRTFVKTSISPWIKINSGDAFQFLLTHNMRHLTQASRNL